MTNSLKDNLNKENSLEITNTYQNKSSSCCCLQNREIGNKKKWVIYIIGLVEVIVFGGVIFGWAQLIFVLKNDGIFSNLCYNETKTEEENFDVSVFFLLLNLHHCLWLS